MSSATHDISRDAFMLSGNLTRQGYGWWWHSFTAHHTQTGEERAFFIEFFCVNPALGGPEPLFGMEPDGTRVGHRPSYLMVKAGTWGAGARQIHRPFGWDEVSPGRGASFWVAADDMDVAHVGCKYGEYDAAGLCV